MILVLQPLQLHIKSGDYIEYIQMYTTQSNEKLILLIKIVWNSDVHIREAAFNEVQEQSIVGLQCSSQLLGVGPPLLPLAVCDISGVSL